MPNANIADEPLSRLAVVLSEQGFRLVLAAGVLTAVGLVAAPPPVGLLALAAAGALASLAGLGRIVIWAEARKKRAAGRDFAGLAKDDPAPCLICADDGEVIFLNEAARLRFDLEPGAPFAAGFRDVFASPGPVLRRLQERAEALGFVREDIVERKAPLRLTSVALEDGRYLWRCEELLRARAPSGAPDEVSVPMLVATQGSAILYMNEAMQDLVGDDASHLDRILTDLPLRSGDLHQVITRDGASAMRVVAIEGDGHRREVYLFPATDDSAKSGRGMASAEHLPVGILLIREDGTIADANSVARRLVQASDGAPVEDQLLADRLEGLGRPVRDWLEDAAQGRGLGRPEVMRVRSSSSETFLQVTLGRLRGQEDVRLVAVLNDATELKTLEAQFVQSQKMQAIGQLAGGVAHDFNNLLTAISGHCDLMLLRHDQGDPDYGDLVQIHQNANRAASLVGQLLAFSRKQTLQPQVIDLRDTLSDLTHLLNRLVGERVTLTLNHQQGLPPIRADRRQLEQVIMNLVVNARDAMPGGGEIRVETTTRVIETQLERDRATVPAGRYVVVKVEDHGSGIPVDKLTKIFEPFYTTKRTGEGTGLGLSTAYGIVKQSGGFIFVDSVVGTGTVFTLYFPAHNGPVESRETVAQPSPNKVSRREAPVAMRAVVGRTSAAQALQIAPEAAVEPMAETLTVAQAEVSVQPEPMQSADLGIWQEALTGDERLARASEGGAVAAVPDSALLPARDDQGQTTSQEDSRKPKPHGEGVILLVEDEAPVRAFASRALRLRGYTVIEAECAEEALATLEDRSLEIDLFVTDVIMPGMDGPSWVRQARETRPDVKVVFVSGYAEDSFGDEQARIPNSVFLPKPFSLSELTATVQDQIH